MDAASVRTCALRRMALFLFALIVLPTGSQASPQLAITQPTSFAQCGYVQGTAAGIDPSDYYVAVVIYIPGLGWYSKPYCDESGYYSRVVGVAQTGTWSAAKCTGGIDYMATMVEAYLIPKASYPACYPTCISGFACIPPSLAAASAASDRALCRNQRTIRWSGYDWLVKSSVSGMGSGRVGPGSNYFSDSIDNVWVDEAGRLHLKITYADGRWNCAEIVSATRLGYGTYRFDCGSRLDNLDKYVTLGLFTWSDLACVSGNREIDIEFTTWGDSILPNNAQFVVQPFGVPGNMARFTMTSAEASTHEFQWRPDTVSFLSRLPGTPTPIHTWEFARTADVPPSADERVHLNLWLNNNSGPSDGQPVEIVLSRFEFVPFLDHPLVGLSTRAARDAAAGLADDRYSFRIWGKVIGKDRGGLLLYDGHKDDTGLPLPIRILDPGHTFGIGSFLSAEGSLGGAGTELDATTGRIRLVE